MEKEQIQILLEEWKDIRASLRYFGNRRFSQLTVFLLINGLLINAVIIRQAPQNLNSLFNSSIKICGIIFCLLFFIMERRSVEYWRNFVKRAEDIEATLGTLALMACRPKRTGIRKIWTSTCASYALYISFLVFWLISLLF